MIARSVIRDVLKQRGSSQWAALIAGWRAGSAMTRNRASALPTEIVIINPLGGALAHYTTALASLLRASGTQVRVLSIDEPSESGRGRVGWLLSYLELLLKAGKIGYGSQRTRPLVTWPVLGFLDLFLVRAICGKASAVVFHDPKPLVRSVGSGRGFARLASFIPSRPRVVVHSSAAAAAMQEFGLGSDLDVLAHPMVPPARRDVVGQRQSEYRPVVRVLGQFKQDRDLDVLRGVAEELAKECVLEITGRGWPEVAGWSVDSRFVSEAELDDLVRTSDAILVPYKRFYQSGIAMRALEAGTPVVGRAGTSLADLYGSGSKLLVADFPENGSHSTAWATAIRHAIVHGSVEVDSSARAFFDAAVVDWTDWVSMPIGKKLRVQEPSNSAPDGDGCGELALSNALISQWPILTPPRRHVAGPTPARPDTPAGKISAEPLKIIYRSVADWPRGLGSFPLRRGLEGKKSGPLWIGSDQANQDQMGTGSGTCWCGTSLRLLRAHDVCVLG